MSASPVTVVNVGYQSTNFWVVSAGRSRLLVDLGWPGMVGRLLANFERADIPLAEVRYGLATHYHPDHAGAAEDLKQRGKRLIVLEEQLAAVALRQSAGETGPGAAAKTPGEPYDPVFVVGGALGAALASAFAFTVWQTSVDTSKPTYIIATTSAAAATAGTR